MATVHDLGKRPVGLGSIRPSDKRTARDYSTSTRRSTTRKDHSTTPRKVQ